ncbi:hypothetical protein RJ641_018295 [Dillenia turbinata]|uniref:Uncharacterized protein n=1 Tax=Dillenia turbinata TaxID=194707 RepID=A0AAN8UNR1_9MAGN
MEHHVCTVDLLGRAGFHGEAIRYIEQTISEEPPPAVWTAMLGACKMHKNFDLSVEVAEHLLAIESENPGHLFCFQIYMHWREGWISDPETTEICQYLDELISSRELGYVSSHEIVMLVLEEENTLARTKQQGNPSGPIDCFLEPNWIRTMSVGCQKIKSDLCSPSMIDKSQHVNYILHT